MINLGYRLFLPRRIAYRRRTGAPSPSLRQPLHHVLRRHPPLQSPRNASFELEIRPSPHTSLMMNAFQPGQVSQNGYLTRADVILSSLHTVTDLRSTSPHCSLTRQLMRMLGMQLRRVRVFWRMMVRIPPARRAGRVPRSVARRPCVLLLLLHRSIQRPRWCHASPPVQLRAHRPRARGARVELRHGGRGRV